MLPVAGDFVQSRSQFPIHMNAPSQNPPVAEVPDRHLPRLFIAGIVGWLLGMVAVFLVTWLVERPADLALALLATLGRWWIGFLVGAVALVVAALVSKVPPARGLGAYLLPMALLGAGAAICVAIYPDRALRDDLMTFLPVALFFYVVALLWMRMSRARERRTQFVQAVLPPLAGGLAVLVGVAAPVFASNAFRYRDSFGLQVKETRVEDGTLVCDGVVSIRKPEAFTFRAPRYLWRADENETENGEITWGATGKPDGATGDFPFTVKWTKGVPEGGLKDIGMYEDVLWLEVRRADGNDEVVYTLSEPLVRRH